jgi:glycosyltransferase involved in cell wall biosynthesis
VNARSARVVHISSVHRANDPRIFEKECVTLARAGYDVSLIATGEAPHDPPFPVLALPRSRRRVVRMLTGSGRAVLEAIRLRPNVVHIHDPELIPWLPLLRLFGIRAVFDSHEDIAATMLHKPYLGPAARKAAEVLGKFLVSVADRSASGIVSATPTIAEGYQNTRSCVVQNFPILDHWATGDRAPGANRLVYIGGLTEERGAWQMLDALALLHASHAATLTLAGPIPASLQKELEQHAAWAYVDYRGILSRAEVSDLLSECSVGVVLFQPLPNHVNSQPTKMFEYMAAGLPVLASDYPLWRRLVCDAGIGVVATPTDPNAIAAAARMIFDDPDGARAMGRVGRRVIEEERNWPNEAEILLNFYERLLTH